jgi:hypothetical protein
MRNAEAPHKMLGDSLYAISFSCVMSGRKEVQT